MSKDKATDLVPNLSNNLRLIIIAHRGCFQQEISLRTLFVQGSSVGTKIYEIIRGVRLHKPRQ